MFSNACNLTVIMLGQLGSFIYHGLQQVSRKYLCDGIQYAATLKMLIIFQIITEYVYELLEKETHLQKVFLPVSAK